VTPPRIGQGLDVHAFDVHAGEGAPARPLVLGGVHIPGGRPLVGHSDADVVLHALVDALLGAAGAGDLGTLVGVDLPGTRDADSAGFVREALDVVAAAGWAVGNADLTVVAQQPRLGPHRAAVRARVADLLGCAEGQVSVKATTTDHLGAIGRGEGIACLAVVLLVPAPGSARAPGASVG
jgi:2-C-methyl-D-erythritol 2,4-cyclodiphosphate synthase